MFNLEAGFSSGSLPPGLPLGCAPPTCLFTRLEESSLVPAGFLTAQLLQKTKFMKALFFFCGKLAGAFFTALLEERRSIEKLKG